MVVGVWLVGLVFKCSDKKKKTFDKEEKRWETCNQPK